MMWLNAPTSGSQSRIRVEVGPAFERLLTGFVGNAEAADVPSSPAGAALGSCPITGAIPVRQPFMVAANTDAVGGDVRGAASMPRDEALSQGAATSVAGGGCSISQATPGSGMTVAAAGPPGDEGLSDTAEQPQPVEVAEVVPKSPRQISDLMDEPAAEVAPVNEAKPAVAAAPARRAKPRVVPETAKKAWWPAPANGKLNLTYAGEASFTGAVALLFDGAFENPDSANQNIQVKDRSGRTVKGTWLVSANRQMLLFGAPSGLYSVNLGSGLADKGGRNIAESSEGHVFIR